MLMLILWLYRIDLGQTVGKSWGSNFQTSLWRIHSRTDSAPISAKNEHNFYNLSVVLWVSDEAESILGNIRNAQKWL